MSKYSVTKILAKPGERDVAIVTVIDAPRDLVFNTANDPKYIPEYWGPKDYTTIVEKMDLRTGGSWRFVQKDQDGKEYAFNGVYKEVSPPERVVQTFNFEPMPGHEMTETITYEEQNGKTIITDTAVFQSVEDRDGMLKTGMEKGSVETMARLTDLVKKLEEEQLERVGKETKLLIVRYFGAPVEKVWKAWIDPAQVKRWWGPKGYTSPVVKIDFREGGKYLIDMRSPEGKEYWSTGVYKKIIPLKKIVLTDSFADENGNIVPATRYGMGTDLPIESKIKLQFKEYDGGTIFMLKYPDLDGLNAKDLEGMRQGWNESFDKLAEALRTPQK